MTEKRFKLSEPHGAYLVDMEDDENYIVGHWDNDDDKIIDLLNLQDQENKNLRRVFEVADRLIMAHCNDDVKKSWVNFQNTKYGVLND